MDNRRFEGELLDCGYVPIASASEGRLQEEDSYRWTAAVLDNTIEEAKAVVTSLESAGVNTVNVVTSIDELTSLLSSDTDPFPNLLILEGSFGRTEEVNVLGLVRHHRVSKVRNLPIIVLTRDHSLLERASYRDMGVDGFLVKPVAVDPVKRCLQGIIRKDVKSLSAPTSHTQPTAPIKISVYRSWFGELRQFFRGALKNNESAPNSPTKIDIWS